MYERPSLTELDKLKTRIQALRAKTIDNGCTEEEALSAASKVAQLLDRYDLSLSDVEMREAPCERLEYETWRKKRIPIDGCVGAVAHFCDCRVWREKNQAGEARYVFFGLRSDVAVAHYLTELIDTAVRSELGRYKTSPDYRRFRHKERHMANAIGMADAGVQFLVRCRVEQMYDMRAVAGDRQQFAVWRKHQGIEQPILAADLPLQNRHRSRRQWLTGRHGPRDERHTNQHADCAHQAPP